MVIELKEAGRRFNQEWIFRNINYTFQSGGKYAILGPNGSGKSTLLSVILGNLSPSEGSIRYIDGQEILPEQIYRHLSFAAVPGNYALAAGFVLTDAVFLEDMPDQYRNVVAVKEENKDSQLAKDLIEIVESADFEKVIDEEFVGFGKPEWMTSK